MIYIFSGFLELIKAGVRHIFYSISQSISSHIGSMHYVSPSEAVQALAVIFNLPVVFVVAVCEIYAVST